MHKLLLEQSGGSPGFATRDCLSRPSISRQWHLAVRMYPTLADKAAALCFSLVMNHPFLDGNKRVGHAAMEVLLVLNDFQLDASVDEQERVILDLAASKSTCAEFTAWVVAHVAARANQVWRRDRRRGMLPVRSAFHVHGPGITAKALRRPLAPPLLWKSARWADSAWLACQDSRPAMNRRLIPRSAGRSGACCCF